MHSGGDWLLRYAARLNIFKTGKRTVFKSTLITVVKWTCREGNVCRKISHNFDCLADLEMTAACETRQTAHVLLSACSSCSYLICLFIVANYSSVLEPVAQMLQSVQLDIVKAPQHISSLINIIKNQRDNAEEHFRDGILSKARPLADKLGIKLVLPRICSRQTHRANTAGLDFESYYRTRLYFPHLDSLVSSLMFRFSSNNNAQFNLLYLHPKSTQELEREEFRRDDDRLFSVEGLESISSFL